MESTNFIPPRDTKDIAEMAAFSSAAEKKSNETSVSETVKGIAQGAFNQEVEGKKPRSPIQAKHLQAATGEKKLKRLFSVSGSITTVSQVGASSSKLRTSIDLQSHKLGASSNPVSLLKMDYFLPSSLIEAELISSQNSNLSSELNSIPKQFNKENVINNLYLLLNNSDKTEASKVITVIKNFTKQSEPYIDEKGLTEAYQMMGMDPQSGALTKNVEAFIKQSDIKNETIKEAAKQAIKKDAARPLRQRMIDQPEAIVLKGGQENMREILASRKADIEGYSDILHLKEAIETENFELTWGKQSVDFPIKSTFLEGYEHIDSKIWDKWGDARKNYDVEFFKQNGQVSNETKEKLADAENALLSYGIDPLSLCKLAFYETKINATDFHTKQFMIGPDPHHSQKKCIVSVDEGRWGPAVDVSMLSIPTLVFRNCLITHPDCLRPVPEEFRDFLKQRLKEMDQTMQKMKAEGLVYPQNEFQEMVEAYQEAVLTLLELNKKINLPYEANSLLARDVSVDLKDTKGMVGGQAIQRLIELKNRYQIPVDENTTLTELKEKIRSHLMSKKTTLKEKAFPKQSEQSLLKEMEREKKMAEYIINNPEASIYGAFEVGYPELKTFMKVFRRMDSDPGTNLAISRTPIGAMPREIAKVIETAEAKNLASPEEIAQMKKDLETLLPQGKLSQGHVGLISSIC